MDRLSSLLKAIFPCLPLERGIQLPTDTAGYHDFSEKISVPPSLRAQPSPNGGNKSKLSIEQAATSIVSTLMDADKAGPSLDATIQSIVHQAGGWSEYLAQKVLVAVESVLKSDSMNAAMREAYDKAYIAFTEVEGFAVEHPIATAVFCTVIALGVLALLVPSVVELLGFCAGFGELGPVEGKSRFLRCIVMMKGV